MNTSLIIWLLVVIGGFLLIVLDLVEAGFGRALIALALFCLGSVGLHALGKIFAKRFQASAGLCVTGLVLILWILALVLLYAKCGTWEHHLLTRDVWHPDWLLILRNQLLFMVWTGVCTGLGLESAKKIQGGGTAATPPC